VPLRGRDIALERAGLAEDGLGNAVGQAPGLHIELGRHVLDALVVDAVHACAVQRGVQRLQPAAGHDGDVVVVAVVLGGIAVQLRAGHLGLDVLVERSAEGHVDQLQTAADAEDGLAGLGKRLDHGQVVEVAHAVAQPFGAHGLLAIAAGPDIGAAVHDHAVQPLGIVLQRHVAARGLACGAGHHHHHGAGRHDPVRYRLLHVLQRLAREKRTLRVRMGETGRKADLEAA